MILRNFSENIEIRNVSQSRTFFHHSSNLHTSFLRPFKRKHGKTTIRSRHTPPSVYFELMIHSKTRVKGVIKKMATLGLSITYNCVREIQEQVT